MRRNEPKAYVLEASETEEAFRLRSLAFERGSRNIDHWHRFKAGLPDGSIELGIRESGRLQAALGVINFQCYFGPDVILPMGGIGAVATLPASRGKGYAGALLDECLARMREAGQLISMLGPFSWQFYQNYGWDWVGVARHYSVPATAIKTPPETENVREAVSEDHAAIREAYARHSRRYRAALVRTEYQWSDLLADTGSEYTSTFVYPGAGGIEGYLSYRGGSRDRLGIKELLSLTAEAQRGLLGLLRRLSMQHSRFEWKAPADDTLWSQFYDWEIETKLSPVFMGRVVDVAGAMEAWKPVEPQNVSVALSVSDQHAPWNEGVWRISCEGDNIRVEKAAGDAQVALDIRAFSQAFFGTPTLPELRGAGRVEVADEAAFQALCRLLNGPRTWMNDFF